MIPHFGKFHLNKKLNNLLSNQKLSIAFNFNPWIVWLVNNDFGFELVVIISKYKNLIDWCKNNCIGEYLIEYNGVSFEKESDAALYKLIQE
jgi:hypothetical protein